MLLPNATFWRLWARALVCIALASFLVLAHSPAQASGRPRHHHHHHHRRAAETPAWGPRHHPRRHRAVLRGVGVRDNVSIAMRYLGSGNPTGSRGPWCGDFMNMVEHLAGRTGIPSRLAIAWRQYGRASAAVRGAIAVFPGHVALVIGRVGDRLQIISGNWSHRVGLGWVSLRSAVAFRKP